MSIRDYYNNQICINRDYILVKNAFKYNFNLTYTTVGTIANTQHQRSI